MRVCACTKRARWKIIRSHSAGVELYFTRRQLANTLITRRASKRVCNDVDVGGGGGGYDVRTVASAPTLSSHSSRVFSVSLARPGDGWRRRRPLRVSCFFRNLPITITSNETTICYTCTFA